MTGEAVSPEPKGRWQRYLFLVGLAFAGVLLWYFGWTAIRDAALSARPLPLVAMAALILAGFWIRAFKWRYALGPGSDAIGVFFLAKMAGNWSPGRLGEWSPMLVRKHRTARVFAWILADRVIEVAFTLLLGVLGMAALNPVGGLPAPLMWCLAGVAIGVAALLLIGVLGLPERIKWREWLGVLPGPIGRALEAVASEARALGGKWFVVLAVTAIAKATDVFAVILLCKAFGYDVSFLLVCAARAAHALVSAIPLTPDATGVPFVAAAYLLHDYGGVPYDVLTVALAFEVAVINLLLWFSFLVASGQRR